MGATIVEAARELVPLIEGDRTRAEAARRIGSNVAEALAKSRIGRVGLPPDLGGPTAPPSDWLEALRELARYDVAAPWILWNNALVAFFARFLEPPARQHLFADSRWLYAQSTRPSGRAAPASDGSANGAGYRVSGRWSLVSGCELADWLMLHCTLGSNGEPDTRFVFIPVAECEIVDTWETGGLRATGSHDVVAQEVWVPAAHTLSPADGTNLKGPIGSVPIICNLTSAFAAMVLGVAASTLETVVGLAEREVSAGPMPDLRDRSPVQVSVARCGATTQAARAHLHTCVDRVWHRSETGEPADPHLVAEVFSAALHTVEVGRETVEAMVRVAGTRGLYSELGLEKAQRDVNAMMRHVVAQPEWLEDAGRVRLGLEPENPLFLL